MANFLYVVAVVLLILWGVGYFGYKAGEFIHLLIVLAVVIILVRLIFGKSW